MPGGKCDSCPQQCLLQKLQKQWGGRQRRETVRHLEGRYHKKKHIWGANRLKIWYSPRTLYIYIYYIILYYIILYYIISYYIVLYCIIWYYILYICTYMPPCMYVYVYIYIYIHGRYLQWIGTWCPIAHSQLEVLIPAAKTNLQDVLPSDNLT